MFSKSPLTRTILYQLSQPAPLFAINWYAELNDHYQGMRNFAAMTYLDYPDAQTKLPHALLAAIAKDREEQKKFTSTDSNGQPSQLMKPVSVAMVNLSKASNTKDDLLTFGFDLTNEFFLMTGEICGMETAENGDRLLTCMGLENRKDSVAFERFSPEKKYLFTAFLLEKNLVSERTVDESGALLGLGADRLETARKTLYSGPYPGLGLSNG